VDLNEANKIIAEYMNWKIIHNGNALGIPSDSDPNVNQGISFGWSYLPSESLDVLVPVWEKIHSESLWSIGIESETMECWQITWHLFGNNKIDFISDLDTTIQQAAAVATAKAILELRKADK